ncbi:MmpS family transport accessory protein [Cryobacterium sp. Y57]|uniref:MmpS family transport accessory protein n=1 Tax=Cryobacterium sp. Y57 TaxID=2048287 RepID=UPI000CE3C101|nr:MmpS family transport accessory protein [Cryobacterium sp. Y57]
MLAFAATFIPGVSPYAWVWGVGLAFFNFIVFFFGKNRFSWQPILGFVFSIGAIFMGMFMTIVFASSSIVNPELRESATPTAVDVPPARSAVVVYELTGDSDAETITFSVPGESHSVATAQALPWSVTFEVVVGGSELQTPLALNALLEQSATTATCRITVDGVVVSEHTGVGKYAVADCDPSDTYLF